MKPGFALSLSFEGIDLLARAAGGWRLVGHVALNDPDLGKALTDLRQKAIDLSDPAFRTKLIIPGDQIRYLSLDTGHVSTAERIELVRSALDGATPYAVEDLVYDICVDGPKTHIAAVARETLEEAEAFASEHRFQPVSFVAIPGGAQFLGEPFFGPTGYAQTALARGDRVEPDGVAVVVIGDIADAPVETAPPVPETGFADPVVGEDPPQDPPVAVAAPVPGFTSRRASKLPELGGVSRSTIAPHIEPEDGEEPDAPSKPLFATLRAPDEPEEDASGGWTSRFLSRRSQPADADEEAELETPGVEPEAPPMPVAPPEPGAIAAFASPKTIDPPVPVLVEAPDERRRMTIFGMRDQLQTRESPRHLGLVLTAVLLIFLAGVAAWASIFLDEELQSWFDRDDPVIAAEVPKPDDPGVGTVEPALPESVASLDPGGTGLSDTDAAVLDALRDAPDSAEGPRDDPDATDEETAITQYAVTGIWQSVPEAPAEPGVITLNDLYLTSIDDAVDARDAVALPQVSAFETDQALALVTSPAAPGSVFAFDERGRIIPTPEGALSPDGFTVVLGRPPVVPPATPERVPPAAAEEPTATLAALAGFRPRTRPDDLVEQTERAQLGGLTLSELSSVRPLLRPRLEKSEEEADETPTAQAVLASITPSVRPGNMAQLVERATREAPEPTQVAAAAPATVAPAVVSPQIPSSASVARAATVNNAINLRRVNLIGVYGTPSNRRALVRLPNGRYKKVEVGDRLDGGRISAIGESELRYQKGGRNLTLTIPSG